MKEEERLGAAKRMTDELLTWASGRGRIVIVVHDNPDPDCLASALALSHLFMMKLNRDAVITFSGMIGRSENLAMARELEIPLTPLSIADLGEYQVVCMLDTQPETGNNSLPPGTRVDIVIDHHPARESSRRSRWVDIRQDYGATSTILYEYLLAQNVSIGTKLATALFYAIRSETQELGREASRADRDAYLRLFPLTSKRLLYAITHPKLPVEYFLTIDTALEHARIYGSVLISNLQSVIFPEIVAEMADFLLRLDGVDTVLAMGQYNDGMIISLRTDRHDINAGEIVKGLVAGRGAAGGHDMMAGGRLDGVGPASADLREAEELLTARLLAEFAISTEKPRKLIRHGR